MWDDGNSCALLALGMGSTNWHSYFGEEFGIIYYMEGTHSL